MRTHWRGRLLAAVLVIGALGACGGDAESQIDEAATPTTTAPRKLEGTVTVYAAQSLSKALTEIGSAFEAEHPGVSVAFNFAGSATLVTQIIEAAPADVFASADQPNMDRLSSSGLIDGKSSVFTKNVLHIVVAKGNPKGIATLADLARSNVATVLCAANVPCGGYARQVLEKAGVQVSPKSDESSVTGVIGRVQIGEADAGIVYVTDVLANDMVSGVDIASEHNVVAEYPHAPLKNAPNPVGAKAFVAYVESSDGQSILANYGFLPL